MVNTKPKLLFVDDEATIRLTLGMYLEENGFAVTTAATVPEALKLITVEAFDVLIADLNVGAPGDGFTVVSAMRRIHPNTVTIILTGYPAFETALEAIRLQVDDYVTKPTDTDVLVQKIREKLSGPKIPPHVETKPLSEIIGKNAETIAREWLDYVTNDHELAAINISNQNRTAYVPRVLQVVLKVLRGEALSDADWTSAREHGELRRKERYTVFLLIREARLLHDAIARCVQANLLAVEISHLISNLITIHQTKQILLEESVAAFLKGSASSRKRENSKQIRS
jgi:ActR/RegA family two-component response regulator